MAVSIPKFESRSDGSYGRVHEIEYDSINHVLDVAFDAKRGFNVNSVAIADEHMKEANYRPDFYNNETPESLKKWMCEPKVELIEAVDAMKSKLEDKVEPPTKSRRKNRYRQEDGEELDPQAVLERRLDGWTRMEHRLVTKHVVTVGVNVACLGSRYQSELLYRGAAALALCDILTQQGHSVEIICFAASNNVSSQCSNTFVRIPIKNADEPLNISSAVVALCDIGFFRLAVLGARARSCPDTIQPGFGRTRVLTQEERNGIDVLIDSDVFSMAAAENVVLAALAKFAPSAERVVA